MPASRNAILSGAPGWVMHGASIDIDFANSRYWGGALSVSRASSADEDDLSGNWTSFAANTLRVSNKGALIEEARTNVALWNRDLTNAAWTKTNVTVALNQIGIDGAANSASSLTATAGNGTVLQAITLVSSARFQSSFVKRITGSGTIQMTMDNGTTWTTITVTGSYTQLSIPTQTLANPTIGFRIVTSGDAIAVDFAQNENGTFATSPILTTTGSVARAADVVTVRNPPAFGSAYTLYAAGTPNAPNVSSIAQNILQVHTSDAQRTLIRRQVNGSILAGSVGGSGSFPLAGVTLWPQSTAWKIVGAFAPGDQAATFNAGTIFTTSGANLPTTPTIVAIGANSGTTEQFNGYITRIAIWPTTRLPNATLQSLTTP